MYKVLLIEDDDALSLAISDGLQNRGYSVTTIRDGKAGFKIASEREWDIIILDVMLPTLDGFDICKLLRSRGDETPIILLTALSQEMDKVLGLKLGADDYLTKPFSLLELSARMEAVMRRSARRPLNPGCYKFGDLAIDFVKSTATKCGEPINLSAREFLLLEYFVNHRGKVISRDELLHAVWGYASTPVTRTVDTHIVKLRQKIEDDPANPRYILTVHRTGYRFMG